MIEGKHFSFWIPPDMQPLKVQGIDSYVGEYSNKEIRIVFDYGWYSESLPIFSGLLEYEEESIRLNGKKADIATFALRGDEENTEDPFKFGAAMHVRDLGDGQKKLTMIAKCRDKANVAIAKKILQSVSFQN